MSPDSARDARAAFPIVAIGASAGGLEAVTELLAGLPAQTGMAFLVVQHLDPDHVSLLPGILARRTPLAVVQAHDGQRVVPDHVYVIPPNAALTWDEDRLRLMPRPSPPARFMPVDILFQSLADARAQSAISVVLSGGDSDGALGTKAIKHGGGFTFAQEPASARTPSMPRSAIETGCVDFVLQPHQIAQELLRLGSHPYLRPPPAPALESAEQPANASEESILRRIFQRLRSAHGVDFTHYKRSTLQRRLARRMALQKVEHLLDYAAQLERDPAEMATLYQDFLIRVTGFFREPECFDALAKKVFPSLCEGRSAKETLRIWVAGCASGEEVYSIAICLAEYLGDHTVPAEIQIFGTDVSDVAIEKARAGVYLDTIQEEVSSERLKQFFVKQDGHYQIAKGIRDLCIFARHDVTRDPPFSRLDLVSCRNLLIYLDAAVQRRVMQVFHYALRPRGVLMLGPSETVGQASELFELTDKHHRLYARKPMPSPGPDLSLGSLPVQSPSTRAADADASIITDADSAAREADRLLLARYAPASFLVDEALNIQQFRGETGPYIEHASGPSSLNLSRVARPELLVEIAPAIQEARASGAEVRRDELSVGDLRDVSIEVIPLKRLSAERYYLILLDDGARRSSGQRAQQPAASALPESEKDRRLAQLERESSAVRDYLQATIEEHEAVKEELRSAHEEVLSANEEFQSTNEELETSKEELQSANEELTTTNDELRDRNRELSVLNAEVERTRVASESARAYADAIIETVREPLLVLDGDLRVLRANRAYYQTFQTRPEESEGRLLYDKGHGRWNDPIVRERLDAVLARRTDMAEAEVELVVGKLGRRWMSLHARRIPGDGERDTLILLAVDDITERRAYTESLLAENLRKDEFLAMLAHELRNPLSPIAHSVHLLRERETDAPTAKLYEMIERQTQRLVRLVDDLIDVARINRGTIELRREHVDLVEILRQAAETHRARIEERSHTLTMSLLDGPVCVDGDPVRLEQAVSNVLENAVKYTHPGGNIAVALTRENGEAVVSVHDDGIGIAPERLESVFDLFMQIDRSLAHTSGGLGLGLTLARRVLALHGGRIEARSAGLGKGTEFLVRLPALPSTQTRDPRERDATQPAKSARGSRRVLVVDDNEDTAQSLALLLRSWGHEVAVARHGAEALALAASFRPESALVDIGLPGMDGYELARRLRQKDEHRDLHLVALTGYGRAEDRDAALAAGFDVHLVKPAETAALKRLLDSAP
jgi:two-component system CheB/CheR fusion protein